MCTLFAYEKPDFDPTSCLEPTIMRGPDQQKILKTKHHTLGFQRLAIMGLNPLGMQPFHQDKTYLMCNGEIYNHKQLQANYHINNQSGSDCEVLLPLFLKLGVNLFKQLDAEFACVIIHDDQLIAARDPLGIRPLYYGYDNDHRMAIASTPQNLVGLVTKIYPFPPAHYYQDGQFIPYVDLCNQQSETLLIAPLLEQAVIKRLDSDAPLGFLLSGGLDSSLVCALAAKHLDKPIRTFAIGMEKDAIDLRYAKEVADYIHADHTEVIMTFDEVFAAIPKVIQAIASYDITTVRASIGMYLICQWIHEHTDLKVLLTGEVSDELFGYKYTDYAPSPASFQAEAVKRIREIHTYDVLRADRCLASHSLEARVPFADVAFVKHVMGIDPAKKMNTTGIGKALLREAFKDSHLLPDTILYRQKAAFSDAVGHSMRDLIQQKIDEQISDKEFMECRQMYTHNRPISKESLYYRRLFELYYPQQEQLIPGFWMPNQAWPNCQVNDPSARVLKNYDQSGQ